LAAHIDQRISRAEIDLQIVGKQTAKTFEHEELDPWGDESQQKRDSVVIARCAGKVNWR